MIFYQIKDVIDEFHSNETKRYLSLYKDVGFELGFGKAGNYEGHSHHYFTDVLYSPKPILTSDISGKLLESKLIIAPHKAYLGDVSIGNFFFIKFSTTADKVQLPDKTSEILSDKKLIVGKNGGSYTFDWFKGHTSKKELVKIDLGNDYLKMEIGGESYTIM